MQAALTITGKRDDLATALMRLQFAPLESWHHFVDIVRAVEVWMTR